MRLSDVYAAGLLQRQCVDMCSLAAISFQYWHVPHSSPATSAMYLQKGAPQSAGDTCCSYLSASTDAAAPLLLRRPCFCCANPAVPPCSIDSKATALPASARQPHSCCSAHHHQTQPPTCCCPAPTAKMALGSGTSHSMWPQARSSSSAAQGLVSRRQLLLLRVMLCHLQVPRPAGEAGGSSRVVQPR